jgi:hypothetical protein
MKRAALSVLTVLSVMLPITALNGGVAHADTTVDPNTAVATVQSTLTSAGVPITIPALPVPPVGLPAQSKTERDYRSHDGRKWDRSCERRHHWHACR